jgi:hypothetical protein
VDATTWSDAWIYDAGPSVDARRAPDAAIADANTDDATVAPDAGPVAVTGTVTDSDDQLVEGATVQILGTTVSASTLSDGTFSMELVPGNYYARIDKAGHWGAVYRFEVLETGLDAKVDLVTEFDMNTTQTTLSRVFDPAKGIVQIDFNLALGGETGTITATSDTPFTYDNSDVATVSNIIIATGTRELVFANAELGTTSGTASGGSNNNCVLEFPGVLDWPVLAGAITHIETVCVNP